MTAARAGGGLLPEATLDDFCSSDPAMRRGVTHARPVRYAFPCRRWADTDGCG